MTPFFHATATEIRNNLGTNAYVILTPQESKEVRETRPGRIMESRYVRTAKPLEAVDIDKTRAEELLGDGHGGPCKAKVRHVMKGFSEDGAETLVESATPQITREGVMFTAQLIASKRWKLGSLNFTQVFHSGDPIQRQLYAEQPPE